MPEKYYLSPTACGGIIRRSEKRGKELPAILKQALLMQAGQNIQTPRKTMYTGPVEVAQGGNNTTLAVNKEPFCIAGNIVNRKEKNGGNGCGYQQGISYTLTTEDRHCIYIPKEKDEPYQKVIGSLCAGDEKMIGNQYVEQGKCIVDATRLVRRLIPLECERLMGFPDYWTDIPKASDSARYRALGNSVAVPCVDFILCGIAMYLSKMGEEEEDVYLSR